MPTEHDILFTERLETALFEEDDLFDLSSPDQPRKSSKHKLRRTHIHIPPE